MASETQVMESSSKLEPAVELGMLWKREDAPLLKAVQEKFGEDIQNELTEVQIRNFIHGYQGKGIETIIERITAKIEYQKEIGHDTFLEDEFVELPMIAQANPVCIYGQDKQGHPVLYTRPCKANYDVCQQFPDLMKTYFIRTLEHLERIKAEISETAGYDIWRHTTVIDVYHLGLLDVKSIYDTLSELTQIANYKYPESAHKIIVINADWKFRFIKALFDYVIEETTAEKVKVLGKDFYETLCQEIDANQIPPDFGGEASEEWQDGGIIVQNVDYPHTHV